MVLFWIIHKHVENHSRKSCVWSCSASWWVPWLMLRNTHPIKKRKKRKRKKITILKAFLPVAPSSKHIPISCWLNMFGDCQPWFYYLWRFKHDTGVSFLSVAGMFYGLTGSSLLTPAFLIAISVEPEISCVCSIWMKLGWVLV